MQVICELGVTEVQRDRISSDRFQAGPTTHNLAFRWQGPHSGKAVRVFYLPRREVDFLPLDKGDGLLLLGASYVEHFSFGEAPVALTTRCQQIQSTPINTESLH